MSRAIVRALRRADQPSRFLQWDARTECWEEASDRLAAVKVSEMLSETINGKAPSLPPLSPALAASLLELYRVALPPFICLEGAEWDDASREVVTPDESVDSPRPQDEDVLFGRGVAFGRDRRTTL